MKVTFLTLKKLKAMKPHTHFAFKPASNGQRTFMFVATRGDTDDWAIYTSLNARPGIDFWAGDAEGIHENGDKVYDKELIRKLVPCDDEAFARYRF